MRKLGALTFVFPVIMFCRLHGFLCSWFRGRDIAALDAHVVIGISFFISLCAKVGFRDKRGVDRIDCLFI